MHEEPEESEVVDGVVVLATRADDRAGARGNCAAACGEVAAVAATGFVAGAATAAVLGRRLARQQARRAAVAHSRAAGLGRRGARGRRVQRRFIVDVHTLARR